MYSAIILSVSVRLDAYSINSVLFDVISGINGGLLLVRAPTQNPPSAEVVIAELVELQTTIPSTVICTLIVRLVASVVLNVRCETRAPTPLTLKSVFSVFAVIAPELAAIDPPAARGDIDIGAHAACVNLLTIERVAFCPPEDGNIDDLKNILKAPLVGAVGIQNHGVCPLGVDLK